MKKLPKKVYHYTSLKNWEKIQEDRALMPLSYALPVIWTVDERIRQMVNGRNYLTALESPQPDSWKKFGLIDYLMKHTTGEVLLEVPVLDTENAFVRDHALYSPRRFLDLCGEPIFDRLDKEERFPEELDKLIHDLRTEYLESVIPFNSYDGRHKVPEIWLPQKTPIKLIKRIK